MQGKVIKFNLVGAIFVLMLIIAIIVGVIIYVPRLISSNRRENDNSTTNNKTSTSDNSIVENTVDEIKTYKETVIINEQPQEITMKKFEGTYGYSIKYDINSFYIEKGTRGLDKLSSLQSETIFINISEKRGDFDKKMQELFINREIAAQGNKILEYNVEEDVLDGAPAVCEYKRMIDDRVIYTYYIKTDSNSYLIMEIYCGNSFEENVMPIIEKMIETFELN